MMEVFWGAPITLVISEEGDTVNFSTIEKAQFWLRRRWPIADRERERALEEIDAAMHCLTSVSTARNAFIAAARTADLKPKIMGLES